MNMRGFVLLSVSIAVAVLTLSSVLVPAVSMAVDTEDTFTNDGFYRMTEISDDEEITITWDGADPFVFDIDGVEVTMPPGNTSGSIFPYTIFATDGWGLRFNAYNSGTAVDLNLYDSANNTLAWYAQSTNGDKVTITLNSGTASFAIDGGATKTETYTQAFIPDNEGEYVLKKGSDSAYLNGDSLIYSTGRTSFTFAGSPVAVNINLTGSIDDGETVTILAPTTGYTSSNVVMDYTEVSGYLDLYKFNKVTFDVTNGSNVTQGATYSQVIVPYEVTAEKAIHADSATRTLFQIIPIFVVLGILLAITAVAYVRYRR